MARYRGALCRICRRHGAKLYLKGSKCDTAKCMFERRGFAPGQHGKRRKKYSEYGLQLREKQKLRMFYGIMEKQFAIYFDKASRKQGVTGDMLMQLLELRLDNVTYRLGFSTGRRSARQLVRHGHIKVNGRKVNIPSYSVRIGDVIEVSAKEKSRKIVSEGLEENSDRPVPEWLELSKDQLSGKIVRLPERDDINVPVDEYMVVELYSK